MSLNGIELVQECMIELTIGRRYGLLGKNGCGKTNLLQVLANREVPVPDHMDLYHLHQEAAPTDRTALESVGSRSRPKFRPTKQALSKITALKPLSRGSPPAT